MAKKIICFNGPPGCGKDTAVNALASLHSDYNILVHHSKLAEPLKNGVHKLFGLNYDPIYYEHPDHRAEKDQPLAKLFGMTPREAYIWMSEEVMKPKFGPDVFGKLAAMKLRGQKADLFAFSDAGFVEELIPLIDEVGIDNFLLVEIQAEKAGKLLTFDGDSRSYIKEQLTQLRAGVKVRTIYNEIGGVQERMLYRSMVLAVAKKFMGIKDDE